MPQRYESTLQISDLLRGNATVGAGISSWVHRLDAVTKCYTSDDNKERDREIAVFERLCLDDVYWERNIVRYYGVLNGCVVLKFASHGSIRQYFQTQSHKPSLSVQLRWAEQVTDAISFLHSKGIMHCDISCNNIFLDDNLNAMVGDFAGSSIDGKKCLSWYETSHSHPDTEDPSEKTEIFALGSTFYEIITRRKPYEGRDIIEIERAFRKGDFPNLKSLSTLNTVILNCWHGQYQTTADLLRDVKNEARAKSTTFPPNNWQALSIGLVAGLTLAILLPVAWWVMPSGFLSRH